MGVIAAQCAESPEYPVDYVQEIDGHAIDQGVVTKCLASPILPHRSKHAPEKKSSFQAGSCEVDKLVPYSTRPNIPPANKRRKTSQRDFQKPPSDSAHDFKKPTRPQDRSLVQPPTSHFPAEDFQRHGGTNQISNGALPNTFARMDPRLRNLPRGASRLARRIPTSYASSTRSTQQPTLHPFSRPREAQAQRSPYASREAGTWTLKTGHELRQLPLFRPDPIIHSSPERNERPRLWFESSPRPVFPGPTPSFLHELDPVQPIPIPKPIRLSPFRSAGHPNEPPKGALPSPWTEISDPDAPHHASNKASNSALTGHRPLGQRRIYNPILPPPAFPLHRNHHDNIDSSPQPHCSSTQTLPLLIGPTLTPSSQPKHPTASFLPQLSTTSRQQQPTTPFSTRPSGHTFSRSDPSTTVATAEAETNPAWSSPGPCSWGENWRRQ